MYLLCGGKVGEGVMLDVNILALMLKLLYNALMVLKEITNVECTVSVYVETVYSTYCSTGGRCV